MSGAVALLDEPHLKPALHRKCWVQVNGFTDKKREPFNGQQGQIKRIKHLWCRGCWRVKLQSGRNVTDDWFAFPWLQVDQIPRTRFVNARPENIISIAPPHFADILPMITKSGRRLQANVLTVPPNALRGKTVALYFSASWCRFCKEFTPKLLNFYDKMKE